MTMPHQAALPHHEVFAIKYAELKGRHPTEIFLGADPHEALVDMDYYIWVVRSPERVIVFDLGFNAEIAARRGRHFLRCPTEGLAALGIDAATVTDVVISHMHYDHVGNYDLFPAARLHLQDREMHFATGRHMRHRCLCAAYEVEDVCAVVRKVYAGSVEFHDGDAELAPGLSLHLSPGHTAGLQVLRVSTARGWMVLASDACHYRRHLDRDEVFPLVADVAGLLDGYRKLRRLASGDDMIIPGHDPLILQMGQAVVPGDDLIVRLA